MKKSILALLLALVLVAPAFASEKGDTELVFKVGLNLNPNVAASGELVKRGAFKPGTHEDTDCNVNNSLLIGAEIFAYLNKNVALGLGINNNFNADLKDLHGDGLKFYSEIGFTNFYFAVKPKIELESKIFNSIYFLGQLGYSLLRFDNTWRGQNVSKADDNGLYWGIGVGTEIKDCIVELLYSVNYGTIKANKDLMGNPYTADLTYKTLTLNVGFKFNI